VGLATYAGLVFVVLVISFVVFRRSHGRDVTGLRQSGLYRFSRNPQVVAFLIAVVGNLALWPTWETTVSLLLLAVLLRMMIHTEQEHLLRVFGEEYVQYCRRVPRLVGLPTRSRTAPGTRAS
jgi:protein-S-isoprenylcysteine O-methyltransferase Ste14